MSSHISHQPVTSFLRAAMECSIYHAPTEPGLTVDELIAAGEAAGFLPGEIDDAFPYVTTQTSGGRDKRLPLNPDQVIHLMIFIPREEPDYRNLAAFDFVIAELRQSARMHGQANAKIERSVMVEHAVSRGLPRLDVEAAITIMIMNEILIEKDGVLGFASGKAAYGTPSDQLKTPMQRPLIRKDARARAYPIVKNIIDRRTELKNIMHPTQNDEWISAADAINLLGIGGYAGSRTICKRAHAGLIKARAERFVGGEKAADNVGIPANFWWAEGENALKQNWATGDFETRLNHISQKAFGVTFCRSDIARIKPASVQAPEERQSKMTATRTKVFIGHGRSPVWRELKDYLREHLQLDIEEFNSISTAGIATVDRLEEMLEVASFAFLVMTAEDEQPDGKFNPRMNVIHEAGLFQGRLGFKKAIILLEEGCEEFSNKHGLGDIRFPRGSISAKFHEIHAVLKREKIVT
jgi:predicted nucleotide-binding protein